MPEYEVHPLARLFENPNDHGQLLAPDLDNPLLAWQWPNKVAGWDERQLADEHPDGIGAKALPAERGAHSGWPGVRVLTAAERAARRAAARGPARPAHRPPLAYEDKVAHVSFKATNGDVIKWARRASDERLTIEDWILSVVRAACEEPRSS